MGPRSDERGKVLSFRQPPPSPALQWGRVRMNAASEIAPLLMLGVTALQWGRVRMNAESWARWCAEARPGIASMGPRSDERGKEKKQSPATNPTPLQWGRVRMNAES